MTATGTLDFDRCYAAVASRDPRFDGDFVLGVTSTGIYCRPSCPARTPARRHARFFLTAAAAQRSGFRACRRCVPDAVPGSPRWNHRADVVGRALRLIADGTVDRVGVRGLAAALAYSERHLRRLLLAEVGAGPLELARSQRAQTARVLIETTDLPMSRVAFAAGYGSIRAFNDALQEAFSTAPQQLRARARRRQDRTETDRARPTDPPGGPTRLALRLAHRSPADLPHSLAFLDRRAVPGLEELRGGAYRRTLRLPHGHGVVTLRPADVAASTTAQEHATGFVHCDLQVADLRDVQTAVHRCRTLLDLDADPRAVEERLGDDPLLGRLVRAHPGRRMLGAVDGAEAAVRVVVGQQVSVAGARTQVQRLVDRYGAALTVPDDSLSHVFPDASVLAAVDPGELSLPGRRARALVAVCAAVAGPLGGLGPGSDPGHVDAVLAAVPGVGPWTRAMVRMRALADPDVLPWTDAGVRRGLAALAAGDEVAASGGARWRPWRSYAAHHLWAVADGSTHPDRSDSPEVPR